MNLRQHVDITPTSDATLVSSNSNHRVHLRHPGYIDSKNILLTLLAQDRPTGGIHYGTVLTICGIIAGNRWDGSLSRTRSLQDTVQLQLDDILDVGDYYLIFSGSVSDDAAPYPICPSFYHWAFPHNNLPPSWARFPQAPSTTLLRTYSASNQSSAIAARDQTCRLTNAVEGLEVAHIIPAREEMWFDSNSMGTYTVDLNSQTSVNDAANLLLLRADVHRLYDQDKWTIIPKRSGAEEGDAETKLVFHVLTQSTELSKLYHNVPIRSINGVSIEYLLARFACAIFPALGNFLRNGIPRWLITTEVDGSQQVKEYSPTELASRYSSIGSRSRSVGPRKRQIPPTNTYALETVVDGDYALPTGMDIGEYRDPKRPKAIVNDLQFAGSSPEYASQPKYIKTVPSSTLIPVPHQEMAPTPAASQLSGSKLDHAAKSVCLSERRRFDELREAALLEERAKSGTAATWQRERDWAESAVKGPLSPVSLKRWLWVRGNDNYVDVDESVDYSDNFAHLNLNRTAFEETKNIIDL